MEPGGRDKLAGNSHRQPQNDYDQHLLPTEIGNATVPVILFNPEVVLNRGSASARRLGERFHLTFKLVHTECRIVKSLLAAYGFHEVHPSSPDFNLTWTNAHIKPGTLHSLTEYQKVNHFPRSFELTRKDRLYKNIQHMQKTRGTKAFDIIPQSFLIPMEYAEFCHEYKKWRGNWIVKPLALSRGRGIFIVSKPDELPIEEPVLVAKYIENPLLISGYKFDLRIYVAVTSFDPLVVYLYKEGLARFATEKYRKGVRHLSNQCMHLTNYSVNRHSANYIRCYDPNVEDYGNKWSLTALLCYLQKRGCNTTTLMAQITDIIVKSLISAEFPISSACKVEVIHPGNCFELFGFDVLVDEALRPWLLEINFSPSLACDMPLDLKIKSKLVADLLSLSGIVAHDPLLLRFQKKKTPPTNQPTARFKQRGTSEVNGNKNVKAQNQAAAGDEGKIIQMIQEEQQRCGEFVRIIPCANSWELYGQYFEGRQCYNFLLHKCLYPSVGKIVLNSVCKGPKGLYKSLKPAQEHGQQAPKKFELAKKFMSAAFGRSFTAHTSSKNDESTLSRSKDDKSTNLSKSSLELNCSESEGSDETQVIRLLKMDETLSQVQARRVFSSYLFKVGQRLQIIMKNEPLEEDRQSAQHFRQQMDLVLQFLNYASENLFSPITIISPQKKKGIYKEGEYLLIELNKFLQAYNQETSYMCRSLKNNDREYFVKKDVFEKFIESAKASELEEVLMLVADHHSTAWFLGTRYRSSSLPDSQNWDDVTLGNIRGFQQFFPQKSQSIQDCRTLPNADVLFQPDPTRNVGRDRRDSIARAAISGANNYSEDSCHASSARQTVEPQYLIGEFKRVKTSIYRAAKIYSSKHTM